MLFDDISLVIDLSLTLVIFAFSLSESLPTSVNVVGFSNDLLSLYLTHAHTFFAFNTSAISLHLF
jgi:hypothetical protein